MYVGAIGAVVGILIHWEGLRMAGLMMDGIALVGLVFGKR